MSSLCCGVVMMASLASAGSVEASTPLLLRANSDDVFWMVSEGVGLQMSASLPEPALRLGWPVSSGRAVVTVSVAPEVWRGADLGVYAGARGFGLVGVPLLMVSNLLGGPYSPGQMFAELAGVNHPTPTDTLMIEVGPQLQWNGLRSVGGGLTARHLHVFVALSGGIASVPEQAPCGSFFECRTRTDPTRGPLLSGPAVGLVVGGLARLDDERVLGVRVQGLTGFRLDPEVFMVQPFGAAGSSRRPGFLLSAGVGFDGFPGVIAGVGITPRVQAGLTW